MGRKESNQQANFNITSIMHPYLDQYIYDKQTDFNEMMLLNQHHFIKICKWKAPFL